jgi:hypothetical protein
VTEDGESSRLPELIEEEREETNHMYFGGKLRYLGASFVVTIPANVSKELGLKLGDRATIQVLKREDVNARKGVVDSL